MGSRGEISLPEVQCRLDREGASDLVIDLIMNATSDRLFQESILLAIALLEGGNPVIQVRSAGGCFMTYMSYDSVLLLNLACHVQTCSEFRYCSKQ